MDNFAIPAYPATAPMTGGMGGFGGGEGMWLFALLILFGIGGNGFGGRDGGAVPEVTGYQMGEMAGRNATKDDIYAVQNSTNQGFSGIYNAVTQQTSQLSNGISSLGFDLANRMFAISGQISDCCCKLGVQISEGLGQVRYDMAQFAAQTNERILMGNQRVLDALAADKAERQNDRIRNLELERALCGVTRYPTQQTWNAGPYPPHVGCGC